MLKVFEVVQQRKNVIVLNIKLLGLILLKIGRSTADRNPIFWCTECHWSRWSICMCRIENVQV